MDTGHFFNFPNVIVDVLFDKGLLYLVIKNHSHAEAFDIQIAFDKEFSGVQGTRKISNLEIFKHLTYLAPMKEIPIFWDVALAYFSRDEPTDLTVRISWSDLDGKDHAKSISHNIGIYRELGYITNIE